MEKEELTILSERLTNNLVLDELYEALEDYKIFNIESRDLHICALKGLLYSYVSYSDKYKMSYIDYARYQIRMHLKRLTKKYHPTYPLHLIETIIKYLEFERDNHIGEVFTNNETYAEALNIPIEKVRIIKDILDNEDIDVNDTI